MNIRSRILKVAKKILSNTNFTSMDDFHDYVKNHDPRPGTKFTVNGVPVPNPNHGKNQGGDGGEIQMTDEQKKLHKLSDSKDKRVRENVAEDSNTHPKTLHKLSDDENAWVRWGVAKNPNTHQKTLHKLSDDENALVRAAVAGHKNTSKETLDKLSNDESENVKKAIYLRNN